MKPRIIRLPGATEAAIAFGMRLVRRGFGAVIRYPGAWVWDGYDHAFHPVFGFIATGAAWALGEEPMVALQEQDCFADILGAAECDVFSPMELE